MAEILDVAPTKSKLIDLKETLEFARVSHDLLERKREILVLELLNRIDVLKGAIGKLGTDLSEAYALLVQSAMSLGPHLLNQIAYSVPGDIQVTVTPASVMGVDIPMVELEKGTFERAYGMMGTFSALDETRRKFLQALFAAAELAEVETAVYRIALEFKKNQMRVNALENIFIPRYENTIKFIEDVLEERDREELFVIKKVKDKKDRESRRSAVAAV
ncbi:MAG TPA: V-type ATP synthase subunit D [bacterium]|nr:V-type ATP synthase subunit D [bacterium]